MLMYPASQTVAHREIESLMAHSPGKGVKQTRRAGNTPEPVPKMRLPSFGGDPISVDFVSARQDVHCGSTTPEIHT